MHRYQKLNTYKTLRSVGLGTWFFPEFFSSIKNPKVREPLMRIAHEINEDLEFFNSVLKDFGCNVIRAEQPTGKFDVDNPFKPPLQVRDRHCVIGNRLYQINKDFHNPYTPILNNYCSDITDLSTSNFEFYETSTAKSRSNYNKEKDIWYSKSKYDELAGDSWPNYSDFVNGDRSDIPAIQEEIKSFTRVLEYETKEFGPLQAPNLLNTEHTLFVDSNEYCDYAGWVSHHIKDHRSIKQFTSQAAHTDGCFVVIGPKTILGIYPLIDYEKYFPGYDIIRLPTEAYSLPIDQHKMMKSNMQGHWWLADEEHNLDFVDFVETSLKDWVGYIAETIFDVNVLNLDENTVCVMHTNSDIIKQLNNKGIDCVVIPWRQRFFVDCGLHCITLDLNRDC
jgi:hypothetical protein